MDQPPTSDLRGVVARIGGDLYNGGRSACIPGPGHSRRDRSLSLTFSNGRWIWHSHANDPPELVWPYLEELGLQGVSRRSGAPLRGRNSRPIPDKAERERRAAERAEDARKLAFCAQVWGETVEAAGTPVMTYLRGRGVLGPITETLRFHPAMPWGYPEEGKPKPPTYPAMLALASSPDGRHALGVHATALAPDGSRKADLTLAKRMFGKMTGAVVRLGAVAPGEDLAIAEGIETALSFRDLNSMPCWAAMSAGGLRHFTPPPGIGRLFIAADGDKAGIEAGTALGERLSRRLPVTMLSAPEGQDWNDIAREGM